MVRPGRAIAGAALIGLGGVIALGWWDTGQARATDTVHERVRSVELANSSGSVSITKSDTEVTRVRQEFRYRWTEPERAFEVSGGELVLGGCGWNCSVDYTVTVPRGTTVSGDVGSGDIDLTGVRSADVVASSGTVRARDIDGPVTVQASSGDVELADIRGAVDVRASSGSVRGTGLRDRAEVHASSGDVDLATVRPADVTIEANSGDIALSVPDRPYRVTGVANGAREIGIPQDESAAYRLRLHADSGSLRVNPGS